MLITRLELENFKSYRSADIAFRPGTTAILGPNGAGKSTLLEAIGFALFSHKEDRINLADLLYEGEKSGAVIVTMISSYDQREYEIERRLSSKTVTRYRVYDIELGRAVVAEGNVAVTAWLRQHLRVDSSSELNTLFRNTIGVPQGTFAAPFLLAAGDRKMIFDPLLQVDSYRKAFEKLRDTSSHLDKSAQAEQNDIARLQGQLDRLPNLCAERVGLQGELAAIQGASGELEGRLAEMSATLEQCEQTASALRQAEERLRRTADALSTQRTLLEGAKRRLDEAEEACALVASSQNAHQAYLEAEGRLKELEQQRQQRDRTQRALGAQETALAGIAARLEQLARDVESIQQAEARLGELAPLVAEQRELEELLEVAKQDALRLELAQRQEAQAARELDKAQEALEKRCAGLQQAAALERELNDVRAALEALNTQQQTLRDSRARAQAELEALRQQSEALQDVTAARCPICEAELTPAHRAELLARNAQQEQALQAQMLELEAQLGALTHSIAEHNQALAHRQKQLQGLPTAQDVHEAEERVVQLQVSYTALQAEIAALHEAPQRVAAQRQALAALGDPRLEYRACEERVKSRVDREREQTQFQRDQHRVTAEIERLREQLSAFAGLDEAWRVAQQQREQHRPAHDTYIANQKVAEQRPLHAQAVQQGQEAARLAEQALAEAQAYHEHASSAYDGERHAQVKQQVSDLREQRAAWEAQAREKDGRLQRVQQEIAALETLQSELAQKELALRELQDLQEMLERMRNLLREAGPLITRQLVRQISWEASTLYGDIMDDHSGRLEWSEDYELALEVKGNRRAFQQLSGGEQMSAALALRLALLRKTSSIDVAFFDEPTAHLDPERRGGLAEKIMQVKGFSQLFVISHDDTFERAAQNYIRIVKDAAGSRVVEE